MQRTGGNRRVAFGAVAGAVLLLAAACSGGSGDTSVFDTSTTVPPTTVAATTVPSTTSPPTTPPTTQPSPVVDPLVIAIVTEPASLDGQVVNNRDSRIVVSNLFETLLTRDVSGALVPGLALGVTAVDDTTWEVDLRPGVSFHDGSAFDADAAAFSINRILVDGFTTARRAFTGRLVEATVVDESTIRITTDGIDALLPLKLANIPMVPSSAGADFGTNPVGTGPYRFASWDPGNQIDLVAFDGYWGGPPAIASYSVKVFADADAAAAALADGTVDLVPGLTAEQAATAPVAVSVPSTDFSFVQLNTLAGDLTSPEVRVALNHAIDKDALAAAVYGDTATPSAAQNVSAEMLGFNPDLMPYPYDPELARTMLEDAGAADLEVTLYVPLRRWPGAEETVDFVATQLEAVGVTVEVMQVRWADFREGTAIKGDEADAYEAAYIWSSSDWFDTAQLSNQVFCAGATSKHCDDGVDRQFRIARRTTDQGERAAAYATAWELIHANPHGIFLLQQHMIHGSSNRLVWTPRIDDEYLVASMSLAG